LLDAIERDGVEAVLLPNPNELMGRAVVPLLSASVFAFLRGSSISGDSPLEPDVDSASEVTPFSLRPFDEFEEGPGLASWLLFVFSFLGGIYSSMELSQ
jgi:hypothetical protein